MANINKIYAKLSNKKTEGIPVNLASVRDVVNDYLRFYEEHLMALDNVQQQLNALRESAELMLNANTQLRPVFQEAEVIWEKATDLGLEEALPEEITEIFDLDVAAGFNKVKDSCETIISAIDQVSGNFDYQ